MSCSIAKSFASEASQWRCRATRKARSSISFSHLRFRRPSFWGPRDSVKAGDLHSKHTTPLQLRIHLANPELQKLIDGNRASAGRNKIKQHQCVHHFRLVKPIVDTICPINRLVARNYRWRVRKEGYRTNDQKAKGCQRREKSDRDA